MFACGAETGGKGRCGRGAAVQAAARAGTVQGAVKAAFNRCWCRKEAGKTGRSGVPNMQLAVQVVSGSCMLAIWPVETMVWAE